ncbi:MAG: DUF1501 domain-containing protein [Planctomycetia bacterium]|nr:DUF1501 domain-containing protein [Planctomycetia bacterium]
MLHRRDLMLGLGLGAMSLPRLLASPRAGLGRAKSCILIFLWGGPPQQDLFDLKPDAPVGIRSPFKSIATNVPGITFSDRLPRLAQNADKLCVVRSVSHPSNEHEAGVFHMLTGRPNPSLRVPMNQRKRSDFPNIAGVISRFSPTGPLPAAVTVPQPIGHDGTTYSGTYAGWLGPQHDPLEIKAAHRAKDEPVPLAPHPEVGIERLLARRALLNRLETTERALQRAGATSGLNEFHEQALRMVLSPAARLAFDLDREPPTLRERYGRNPYGDCFLLSRRLVEAGVRLVTFNWLYVTPTGVLSNVWDNHGGTGALGGITGYAMLDAPYCCPPLDRGLSALLEDLHIRGLLDQTLVMVMGEMGRTPKINATAGRDHWGAAQSVLLAGGGVRGGQVYGATDAQAAFVKDRPVKPEDLLATAYTALGIAPEGEMHDREGRPYRASEGRAIDVF